jgi:polysaccharide export outer membrane protein
MDKSIGAILFPVLFSALLVAPLSGCGAKKNVPYSSGSSLARDTENVSGAVSGPTGAGSAIAPSPSMYRIGPEDLLRISVWNNKDLTLDIAVRPDGKISLPLIQDVQAEGLTPPELSDVIHQKLLQYIKDPHVSVIVLQVNASKFYIVGEVSKPGTYFLRGEMSVLQALSMAGGFTTFASPKNIRLVRNLGGKQDVRVINYFEVIENGSRQNYLILPGDTLVVP